MFELLEKDLETVRRRPAGNGNVVHLHLLVGGIGLVQPHIASHTAGTEHRAAEPPVDRLLGTDLSDPAGPVAHGGVFGEDRFDISDGGVEFVEGFLQLIHQLHIQGIADTAGLDGCRGDPRSAVGLQNVQEIFPDIQVPEHDGMQAHGVVEIPHPHHVRRDPGDLAQQRPHPSGKGGDLHPGDLLDRHAVTGHGVDVVHKTEPLHGDDGSDEILAGDQVLKCPPDVADLRIDAQDLLPVAADFEADRAAGRMGGAPVEDHLRSVGIQLRIVGLLLRLEIADDLLDMLHLIRFVGRHVEIDPKGEFAIVVGADDQIAEIRMMPETDAEHGPGLPFVPLRRGHDGGDGIDLASLRLPGNFTFDPAIALRLQILEEVVDLHDLPVGPVGGADGAERPQPFGPHRLGDRDDIVGTFELGFDPGRLVGFDILRVEGLQCLIDSFHTPPHSKTPSLSTIPPGWRRWALCF